MRKNQNQLNKNGKRHGNWVSYHHNGELMFKGDYTNGEITRYWEYHSYKAGYWSCRFVKVFHI